MRKALFLPLFLMGIQAQAASLSVVGAMNLNRAGGTFTSSGLSISWGNTTTFGFGLLLSGEANPFVNIEAGLLYLPRRYEEQIVERSLDTLEVPVVLRFSALPVLSFAAGGYFARVVNANATETFLDQNDYGIVGSVAIRVPVAPTLGVLLDVRYLHGIANLDKRAPNELERRDFQILAGLNFSI